MSSIGTLVRVGGDPPSSELFATITEQEAWVAIMLTGGAGLALWLLENDPSVLPVPIMLLIVFILMDRYHPGPPK